MSWVRSVFYASGVDTVGWNSLSAEGRRSKPGVWGCRSVPAQRASLQQNGSRAVSSYDSDLFESCSPYVLRTIARGRGRGMGVGGGGREISSRRPQSGLEPGAPNRSPPFGAGAMQEPQGLLRLVTGSEGVEAVGLFGSARFPELSTRVALLAHRGSHRDSSCHDGSPRIECFLGSGRAPTRCDSVTRWMSN